MHNHNMNMNYARVCVSEKKHSKDLRRFPPRPSKQFNLSVQKFIILKAAAAAAADQISSDTRVKRSHVLSFIKQNTNWPRAGEKQHKR